ncbi:MAG: pantoate--beta-alanine ligase [Deltaproteobacteria bacterium]|nr:pantoate--beta-alanine ligase [Deltaproteobacteria bacterium]
MKVFRKLDALRAFRRENRDGHWGLVPTMGFLHPGHLELVRRARADHPREDGGRVAVSLFVNPTQFGEPEDLAHYPRALERDLQLLEEAGVDLVFCPSDEDMYPPGFQTYVHLEHVTQPLEGASRPTHFRGVATVLAKLFNLVQPDRAYFGQKDAQQTVVVRRLVKDLDFDLEVVVCPTVREADGLAMSSRNARLSEPQRAAAPVLFRTLQIARQALEEGERDGDLLRQRMRQEIRSEPLAELDYVSVADPDTLLELPVIGTSALLSLAVSFGAVRLIDNLPIDDLKPINSEPIAE